MNYPVFALPAAAPRTRASCGASIGYAALLVVMAVAQLFTYDDFVTLIRHYELPFSLPVIAVLPALIIVYEVFALPFLLRMSLSPAFRWFSMILGWLTPALWLFLSCWGAVFAQRFAGTVETVGFLGTVGSLPLGWWAVGVSACMAILAGWASWGLWPGRRK